MRFRSHANITFIRTSHEKQGARVPAFDKDEFSKFHFQFIEYEVISQHQTV